MYERYLDFYSPAGRHFMHLEQLRIGAASFGIEMRVVAQVTFRNTERLFARATRSKVQFTHKDPQTLNRFLDGIHFE